MLVILEMLFLRQARKRAPHLFDGERARKEIEAVLRDETHERREALG